MGVVLWMIETCRGYKMLGEDEKTGYDYALRVTKAFALLNSLGHEIREVGGPLKRGLPTVLQLV
jgi:hypothetical protein